MKPSSTEPPHRKEARNIAKRDCSYNEHRRLKIRDWLNPRDMAISFCLQMLSSLALHPQPIFKASAIFPRS